jgi:heme O synthase-like polyprenyltransferase
MVLSSMFLNVDVLNNTGFENLSDFVLGTLNLLIMLSVIVVVAAIIISGFKFILSMGDEEKVKEATRSMAYSLLGLILVFISPAIVEFVIQNILTAQ